MLVGAVVGSGIMAERLFPHSVGLALLANSLATGTALVAIIVAFGPVSGAHLNPAVTVASAAERGTPWREVPGYVLAQFGGGACGVGVANLMFGEPLIALSIRARGGIGLAFSECVATFGLLCVVWGCTRARSANAPLAVACYIVAAYWFTSSTSFANPAVTVARAFTNTFTGIRPADVPAFVLAQIIGAAAATALFRWLVPALPHSADRVVVPTEHSRPQG